jgi:hypothetical protein
MFSGISSAVAMIRWRWKSALCLLRRKDPKINLSNALPKRFIQYFWISQLTRSSNYIHSVYFNVDVLLQHRAVWK